MDERSRIRLVVFLVWVTSVTFVSMTTVPGAIVTTVLVIIFSSLQGPFLSQVNGAFVFALALAEAFLVWILFWTGAWFWYYRLRRS